jgi:hypothetical protein
MRPLLRRQCSGDRETPADIGNFDIFKLFPFRYIRRDQGEFGAESAVFFARLAVRGDYRMKCVQAETLGLACCLPYSSPQMRAPRVHHASSQML